MVETYWPKKKWLKPTIINWWSCEIDQVANWAKLHISLNKRGSNYILYTCSDPWWSPTQISSYPHYHLINWFTHKIHYHVHVIPRFKATNKQQINNYLVERPCLLLSNLIGIWSMWKSKLNSFIVIFFYSFHICIFCNTPNIVFNMTTNNEITYTK